MRYVDALYADGPALAILKYHYHIDPIIGCLKDREIFADMHVWTCGGLWPESRIVGKPYSDVRYVAGQKRQGTVSTAALQELATWDSFLDKAQELGVKDARL